MLTQTKILGRQVQETISHSPKNHPSPSFFTLHTQAMLLEAYRQRARSAHNWTSFHPKTRRRHDPRLFRTTRSRYARGRGIGRRSRRLPHPIRAPFSAWIAAKSRCFSSMITGPAKFPTRRHEKATQSEQNHYQKV